MPHFNQIAVVAFVWLLISFSFVKSNELLERNLIKPFLLSFFLFLTMLCNMA